VNTLTTDILVIGGGSGGLSVASGAAQMGADVILLEGHKMGGDCLNYGCVPSKALLAAGKAAHARETGAEMGISPTTPTNDFSAVNDHVKSVIATIAPHDSVERFESLGVNVIEEYGKFVSPHEVQAGNKKIRARRIVIATGSSPFVPPIPGLDELPFETNETIFDLREKPSHLLVIGGGPIGMEMAQAHRRLGSDVTVIEGAKALAKDDPEATSLVLDTLRNEGIEIAEDAMATKVRGKAGALEVECKDGRIFKGSHLLVAVGRKPNIDNLNLKVAGIETTKTGIKVDAALKTTNRKVYAIGDVTGGAQFTHVAGYHAGIVIRSALFGLPAKAREDHVPYATYTSPELAQIGLTEAAAREKYGDALDVVKADFAANDRAIAERLTKGFIKVMIVKGRPKGVTIVGHQAGEQISLWALVIANRMKMGAVAAMVAPYPTISELSKSAASAYFTPRLFDSKIVKRVVAFTQRWLP